jgi:PadR family transcriptional regulator, regulatory protein PadR
MKAIGMPNVSARPCHGYEIGKLIEVHSKQRIRFRIGSLDPILCRLETKGLISGRWVEKAGERRRRYYRLNAEGRKFLAQERCAWKEFVATMNRLLSSDYA